MNMERLEHEDLGDHSFYLKIKKKKKEDGQIQF